MNEKLQLTDLIDVKILQTVQDGFANMTKMAALTTDTDGVAVTRASNFSYFCVNYIRNTDIGCARCQQCDKSGAELALAKGESVLYSCHAGLLDFAAPIMADGKLVGCFIGGQVLTEPLDPERARKHALELGVDPEEYVAASQTVSIMGQEQIDRSAKFLHMIAEVLSDMAYNKYLVYQANKELERSGNMKSDFLANMSHEIRTPMNAVIGMAEMALREELPFAARNYINQIKDAARSLLTIINDILDFSKIESGKMDIIEGNYEPAYLVYDVANIVMARLKEKDVELILNIAPNLPVKLWGDNIRIKQILLNLANNAAKFTSQGQVSIKVDYVLSGPGEIELYVMVEDTGIGIKKEDIGKLFQSFQQVDSKRNRNIEGTGLGLAISQRLLYLMNGKIWVQSEYGRGSKFSFALPQKVVDEKPSIQVKEADSVLIAGLISNPYVRDGFCTEAASLGLKNIRLLTLKDLKVFSNEEGQKAFLFIEYPMFSEVVETYIRKNPQITAVLIVGLYDRVKYDIPNLLVLKKPVFALNIALILNGEELRFEDDAQEKEYDFVAPEANVLIVDDNTVNLTVAEGLLEPLKMKIDTVTSGKAAIEKIASFHYDIIFMDHMMPELDGVETTHIIRRFHPEYNDVPIIAFTANAVEGTKQMFCREGMNDFIAKPVEIRIMVDKVRQWLPVEKIQRVQMVYNAMETEEEQKQREPISIDGLDAEFAMKFFGSEELFWKTLKEFYRSIDKKARLIKTLEEQEDWWGYTVEVHALKSSSKQIGALSLSEQAAALEKAGNARDAEAIHRRTEEMLKQYIGYRQILEPYCWEEEEEGRKDLSDAVLQEFFIEMRDAAEDLDMDRMEEVIAEMAQYHYEEERQKLFLQLKDAVEEIDVERCEKILTDWEKKER